MRGGPWAGAHPGACLPAFHGTEGAGLIDMTQDKPPEGDGPEQEMLLATEALFRSSSRALSEALQRLEAGELATAAYMPGAMAMVRKALALALTERQAVGKLGNDSGAGGDAATLDLAAARVEVGRRLARLRETGDAGGVSGGAE